MRGMFDDIFRGIGAKVSSTQKVKSQVLSNTPTGYGRFKTPARQRYGIAPKGSSKSAATQAFNQAIAKRQTEIGRNVVVGGTAGAIGISALGRDKNMSAYNPMPAPRGTGRYA
jgi:hypothetical protein